MTGTPTFVEKIVEVHQQLAAAGVMHAFGGAIALGFHIESPRATADLDVNIFLPTTLAREALTGLPSGVSWTEDDVTAVRRDGQVRVFWGRTPVDLFFPQHVLHQAAAARVLVVPFAGVPLPIISATDLTVFKALFDRTRDWADIEAMLEYGEVDADEVRGWLRQLIGDDDPRVARFLAAARNLPKP